MLRSSLRSAMSASSPHHARCFFASMPRGGRNSRNQPKQPGKKFTPKLRFIKGHYNHKVGAYGHTTHRHSRAPNSVTGRRGNDDMKHIDMRELQKTLKQADLDFFRATDLKHPELSPVPQEDPEDEAADRAYLKFLEEKQKRDKLLIAKYVIQSKETRTTRANGKISTYACLVIAGNKAGAAGYGYGKAKDRRVAQEKAFRNVWKNLIYVPRLEGRTFFYPTVGKYNGVICKLFPKSRHSGFTTGPFMAAVFDCFGITDGSAKIFGNRTPMSQVYAAWNAFAQQVSHEDSAMARGKNMHVAYEHAIAGERKPSRREHVAASARVASILDAVRADPLHPNVVPEDMFGNPLYHDGERPTPTEDAAQALHGMAE